MLKDNGRIDEFYKFEALLREIPASIALLRGPDFIFEMANDSYCRLVGGRDVVGKTLIEALPEIKDQPFSGLLRKVFTTGETFHAHEVEVFLQSGPESEQRMRLFLDFTYRRVLDAQGAPYGIFVFAVDVTEKVEARNRIQIEQAKLESVFANATAALAILRGPEAIYEKTNAAYMSLFNDRPLLGRGLLEALPELRGQKFPDLITRAFATGEQYTEIEAHAFLRRSDDGELEERFFDQSYSQIVDQHGQPYGVLVHAIDVTDRVNNRKKFLAEKQKFEAIFYGAGAPMVFFRGPELVYEMFNEAYGNLLPMREITGKPLLEALPELSGTAFPRLIKQVIDSGQQVTTYEELAPLRNAVTGETENRYFDSVISRINSDAGHPFGVFVQATDVTERVNSRKKLEEALSSRDIFLSIASHELKTPITGMKIQAQMMRRYLDKPAPGTPMPARVNRMTETVERGLDRMSRLIDDMLDIGRIQAGKMHFHMEPADFALFVGGVIEDFAEELRNSGIELNFSQPRFPLPVTIDRFRMEQVITNLVTNAIRYAPGAPIYLSFTASADKFLMIFEDRGPGIDAHNLERIFDRFERLGSHQHVSGMGLGLYIVRHIVAAHNGHIHAEPASPRGVRFVVELPRA